MQSLTPQGNTSAAVGVVDAQDVKKSCRLATTGAIVLFAHQMIDGFLTVEGDRILVKDQGSPKTNGIYIAKAAAWVRADDFNTDEEVTSGLFTFVAEGTLGKDSGWILTTDDPIVLGTDPLTFAQFSGPLLPPIPHAASHTTGADQLSDATTAVHGLATLASGASIAAGLSVQANDPRLSDARIPVAHASSHTTGADQISDATLSVHGLATLASGSSVVPGLVVQANDPRLLDMRIADRLNDGGTTRNIGTLNDTQGLVVSGGFIVSKALATGTMTDIFTGGAPLLSNAAAVDFRRDTRSDSTSGTTAKVALLDSYDSTFIVGSTVNCTHATLAAAIAAISGDTKISLRAENHVLAGTATVDCTGRTVVIEGYGATLTLASGVNANAINITSAGDSGNFFGIGFKLDGYKAGQTSGHGINCDPGVTQLRNFTLIDVEVVNAKERGVNTYNRNIYDYNLIRVKATGSGGSGTYDANIRCYGNTRLTDCIGNDGASLGIFVAYSIGSLINPTATGNASDGIQVRLAVSTQMVRVVAPHCESNGGNGLQAYCAGDSYAVIEGGWAKSNGDNGVYGAGNPAIVSGFLSERNAHNGFSNDLQINGCVSRYNNWRGFSLQSYSSVRNSSSIDNNQASSTFSGIYVGSYCAVENNYISGASHQYAIEEAAVSDYCTYGGNTLGTPAAVAPYLIYGPNSRVLDTCRVSGSFTRAAGAGSGSTTVTGLGTGSCPRHFEFFGQDDATASVLSHGSDDGTLAACIRGDENGMSSDVANSVHVENTTASGYTGKISVLGALAGTAQDAFTFAWLPAAGGGRDVTVNYRAWR